MEKIILRKDILALNYRCLGSSFINFTGGKKYTNTDSLVKDFGLKNIMKKLYNEDLDNNNLFKSSLYQSYSELLTEKEVEDREYKENDKCIELYKVDDEFALQIDFNIFLYHLIPQKEFYTKIVPWYYADSKMYFGDSWGEQDEEIIENIQNLSLINFLKRYKGY